MDSIYVHIMLVLVTLGTSVVTLFTGFGVGTIMMPIMSLFFDVKVAIFLAAIVHFFNNVSRLALYREDINWKIIQRFGIVSIVGAFIGSYAQIYLDSAWLKVAVGLFLATYALISLINININYKLPDRIDFIGGFLSGLIGGLIGNQGAIRSLYLLKYELNKTELIVSSALIAVIIDSTRIPIYAYTNSRYLQENIVLLSLIVFTSIVGTVVGSRILPKISHDLFKKIILFGVLILGILMTLSVI
ncbi:sulfite exporter TauE/SafE family protein [Dendrosporobacter sp. 1207_IL3150]|uniref:sulfite exporter TauE/SafE family protein n=1 Tax=Dendrosporobacter sp. 1207_IL3150 TaxID=3084054 RepID=UPI002FD89D4C